MIRVVSQSTPGIAPIAPGAIEGYRGRRLRVGERRPGRSPRLPVRNGQLANKGRSFPASFSPGPAFGGPFVVTARVLSFDRSCYGEFVDRRLASSPRRSLHGAFRLRISSAVSSAASRIASHCCAERRCVPRTQNSVSGVSCRVTALCVRLASSSDRFGFRSMDRGRRRLRAVPGCQRRSSARSSRSSPLPVVRRGRPPRAGDGEELLPQRQAGTISRARDRGRSLSRTCRHWL